MDMDINPLSFSIQGVLRTPQTLKYFKDIGIALRKNGQEQRYILAYILPSSCVSIHQCSIILKFSVFS